MRFRNILENFSQTFSICAAVAAAAGALQAAGLGTAAIEGPRRSGDGRTNQYGNSRKMLNKLACALDLADKPSDLARYGWLDLASTASTWLP